jgi:hypothetical protein
MAQNISTFFKECIKNCSEKMLEFATIEQLNK